MGPDIPAQPTAVIFVNGTSEWESQYTAKINQNLNFGVGYPQYVGGDCAVADLSNLTEQPCGPTPAGSYWLLPDGTQVANYCVTKAFSASGNYTMTWVYPNPYDSSSPASVEIKILVQ